MVSVAIPSHSPEHLARKFCQKFSSKRTYCSKGFIWKNIQSDTDKVSWDHWQNNIWTNLNEVAELGERKECTSINCTKNKTKFLP